MRTLTPRSMNIISGLRAVTLITTGIFLVNTHQLFSQNLAMIAGYLGVVSMLTGLWWKGRCHRLKCQGALWAADCVIVTMLFLVFSTPHSSAPALLPILAYEAELYWPKRGASLGGWTAGVIFLLVWWVRLWAHQPAFSLVTVLFWITVLSVLIMLPLYVVPLTAYQAPELSLDAFEVGSNSQGSALEADLPKPPLSARERDVWPWLLSGASFRDIANQLTIDMSTVKTHASRIYHKCQVRDRAELRERYASETQENG